MNKGMFGNNRINNTPKFKLYLTDYEMDLIIKCMILVHRYQGREGLIFNLDKKDKDNLFYLHRVLSCKANEFFYNKINNEYYKLEKYNVNSHIRKRCRFFIWSKT